METPHDMGAEAVWKLLLAERARHAAELEERDRKLAAQDDARASDHELIERLTRIIRDLQRATFGCDGVVEFRGKNPKITTYIRLRAGWPEA